MDALMTSVAGLLNDMKNYKALLFYLKHRANEGDHVHYLNSYYSMRHFILGCNQFLSLSKEDLLTLKDTFLQLPFSEGSSEDRRTVARIFWELEELHRHIVSDEAVIVNYLKSNCMYFFDDEPTNIVLWEDNVNFDGIVVFSTSIFTHLYYLMHDVKLLAVIIHRFEAQISDNPRGQNKYKRCIYNSISSCIRSFVKCKNSLAETVAKRESDLVGHYSKVAQALQVHEQEIGLLYDQSLAILANFGSTGGVPAQAD